MLLVSLIVVPDWLSHLLHWHLVHWCWNQEIPVHTFYGWYLKNSKLEHN
jgi:hypothetical protein